MVQEVGGSINAKAPGFRMVKVTQKESFIIVASDLLKGVKALSTFQNIPPRSCALLAAHALECALKAFLCHRGKEEEILKKKDHNIEALWNMAHKEEPLDFPKVSPDWVKVLGLGHWRNLYFRYQEGKKDQEGKKTLVHGGQTPALIPMEVELRKLVEMVVLAIKG